MAVVSPVILQERVVSFPARESLCIGSTSENRSGVSVLSILFTKSIVCLKSLSGLNDLSRLILMKLDNRIHILTVNRELN